MQQYRRLLLITGALMMAGAVLWWYAFFSQFAREGFFEYPLPCLVLFTRNCGLARVVGAYTTGWPGYSPQVTGLRLPTRCRDFRCAKPAQSGGQQPTLNRAGRLCFKTTGPANARSRDKKETS